MLLFFFFFFKQKTAYDMRISDWSSDVCSSDLTATASAPSGDAAAAVDGDAGTTWDGRDGDRLVLDLGSVREFGGITLEWDEDAHASRYAVQTSMDGEAFHDAGQVTEGNGGTDWIALPESEARYVGVVVQGGPGQSRRLREASVEPLAFAATPNDFIRPGAGRSPHGDRKRAGRGKRPY